MQSGRAAGGTLNVHPATLLMPDISPQARVTLTVGPGRAAAAGRAGGGRIVIPDISPQACVTLTVGPGRAAAAAVGRRAEP